MNLIEALKGVWRKMVKPKTVESILHVTPTVSNKMKSAIELWKNMYQDESPWITENVRSMGLPAMIASEKARTATIEMNIKVTGDNERAVFMKDRIQKLVLELREQLEYGVALGGFVIKPYVTKDSDDKYTLDFTYTKADKFFPFSFSTDGNVTEAAFVDQIITKDKTYSKLEYHKLVGTTLTVANYSFSLDNTGNTSNVHALDCELGTPIPLTNIPEWANIAPQVTIEGIKTPLFAYFKMPEANTVDLDSPLGASGFSRAVDLIKHADEIYSDLLWELEGSQLAVDVDRTAVNPILNPDGTYKEILPKLQDRLFRRSLDLGTEETYNVFSPAIRDKSIINTLNNQLMRIEDCCFLSRGTLSIVSTSEARTATELKILKQRSYAANQDIQKELQSTLEAVFAIMDNYCDLYDIVPAGEYEVAYTWDDSILIDKDAERQQDLIEVNNGLMSRLEYRMKWYGETEKQALKALAAIKKEQEDKMKMQLAFTMQQQNESGGSTSDAQASVDEKQRAIESNETNENNEEA